MPTESQLESNLFALIDSNSIFQGYLFDKLELQKEINIEDCRTQERIDQNSKEGNGIIDIYLECSQQTIIAIELKLPRTPINEDQISCHLHNLGLKKTKRSWRKLNTKRRIKYLVIGAGTGNKEPNATKTIRSKSGWEDVIYWISWQDIRLFIDTHNIDTKLTKRLDELNIKSHTQEPSIRIAGLSNAITSWVNGYGKHKHQLDELRREMEPFLNSIENQLCTDGFKIYKYKNKDKDRQNPCSLYGNFEKTSIEKRIYKEFHHPSNKEYFYNVGIDLSTGKLYGTLIPQRRPTKKNAQIINDIIAKKSNNSSQQLKKNAWYFDEIGFHAWSYDRDKTPDQITRRIKKIFREL